MRTDPRERVLAESAILLNDREVILADTEHPVLFILGAKVKLDKCVTTNAFFGDGLYTTFMVVIAVVHYDVRSIRCRENPRHTLRYVVTLYF